MTQIYSGLYNQEFTLTSLAEMRKGLKMNIDQNNKSNFINSFGNGVLKIFSLVPLNKIAEAITFIAGELFGLSEMKKEVMEQHKNAYAKILEAENYMLRNKITKCKGKGAALYYDTVGYPYDFTLSAVYVNGRWESES